MSATLMVSAHRLPSPGMRWGDYPERPTSATSGVIGRLEQACATLWMASFARRNAPYRRFASRVLAHATTLRREDDGAHAARLATLRAGLARDGLDERNALEAFALVALACERALAMTPFETQIAAARVMLDNRLVEMATGEGKTMAVALAAAVAALGGTPVHVITANDYLAERDAAALQGFYRACGLSVAAVTQSMKRDARCAAYDASVAYCTARELAFDYLRDGLAQPRAQTALGRRAQRLGKGHSATRATVLRGLCMAIIDEADTVLLDEARMPLVISQAAEDSDSTQFLAGVLHLAGTLRQGADFHLEAGRRVVLGESAADQANTWQAPPSLYASQRRHREATLCQALAALHVYQHDRDYVVREGKVLIVDDSTGRSAPGRDLAVGLLGETADLRRVGVAGDDEDRVLGRVEALVIGEGVGTIEALDLVLPADDRRAVGVMDEERGGAAAGATGGDSAGSGGRARACARAGSGGSAGGAGCGALLAGVPRG